MVLIVRCLICSKELPYTQSDPSVLFEHIRAEHPLASQRSRKSCEKNQETQAKVTSDLETLKRNSASLKSLIDKEIQTDVAWSYFVTMDNQIELSSPVEKDLNEAIDPVPAPRTSKRSKDDKFKVVIPGKTPPAKPLRTHKTNEKKCPEPKQDSPKNERKHRRFYKTSIEKWRPIGDEKIDCPRCLSHKRPIVRTHRERVTESSFVATLMMTCWPLCFSPCIFPEPAEENLHCPVCNYHLGVYDHKNKLVRPNPDLI